MKIKEKFFYNNSNISICSHIFLNFQEVLYHSFAFGLLLAASLTLMVYVNNYRRYNYELLLGASVSTMLYS